MKKLFIICTLMMAVLAASASKRNKLKNWQPDYKLERAFLDRFGTIENVNWTLVSNILTSASFVDSAISERPVKAFFDNDGQYMGMTQQTTLDNLPERLEIKVRAMLCNYTIIDVIEYWNDAGAAYYIKAMKGNVSRLLKAAVNAEPKFIEAVD